MFMPATLPELARRDSGCCGLRSRHAHPGHRRVHRPAVRREPCRRLPARRRRLAGHCLDAARGRRDEPVRDGVRVSAAGGLRDRLGVAVVHPDRRGEAVRPRDAGHRARPALRPRQPGTVSFSSLSGVLITHAHEDGSITLDFPAAPVAETSIPDTLAAALGAEPDAAYTTGPLGDLVVVFAAESAVRALNPDVTAVARLSRHDALRGITVTAPASDPARGY